VEYVVCGDVKNPFLCPAPPRFFVIKHFFGTTFFVHSRYENNNTISKGVKFFAGYIFVMVGLELDF